MIVKSILHTAGSRLLNAVYNLVILLLITHFVGSKGFGVISLILLDITVIQLFTGLIAGGSLIYFTSRIPFYTLLSGAYLWLLLITTLFGGVGVMIHFLFPSAFYLFVPRGYATDIIILVLVGSAMQIHYNLLIGQKRIATYNLLFIFQITLFIVWFSLSLFIFRQEGITSYVTALYVAWFAGWILSLLVLISQQHSPFVVKELGKTFRELIRYGLPTQSALMLHIGNKRLSFYVLRIFAGLSPLGIYSAGVQLTEGLRLIGQSISLVQYSAISNSRDKTYARYLSIQLMKFTLILTFAALIFLFIIPRPIYQWVFTRSFSEIKTIVLLLSPGVLALAATTIFSHYFSGIGHPEINLRANVIGFVFTILLAFLLIPPLGYKGAAITASVNYLSSVVYQYVVFRQQTKTRFSEWFPQKEDLLFFKKVVKQWQSSHANHNKF